MKMITRLKNIKKRNVKFMQTTIDVSDLTNEQQKLIAKMIELLRTQKTAATNILIQQVGFTKEQTANLRSRLRTFNADWNYPEMDAYDKL